MKMETNYSHQRNEDALLTILRRSHADVMAGRTFSQEEAERFLDQRMYEARDKMVSICAAESC